MRGAGFAMTEKELKQLYWLKEEIKQIDDELQKLENISLTKSPIITGLPFGNDKSDNVANYSCDIADLKAELKEKRQKYIDDATRVEKFIDSIEDGQIRQIFRLRHIDGLSWDQIAGEMYMDRRTVSRKYYSFLKVTKQKYIDNAAKVEKFINDIEDSEIRQIFRFRHIDGLSWDQIAGKMYMDRRTVSKKYYAFLKVAHNAHTICDII